MSELSIIKQRVSPQLACPTCGKQRIEARVAGDDRIELVCLDCHSSAADIEFDVPEEHW